MDHKASGRIGAVIIFFVLLFVFSKWGPAINFSTTSQSKGEPFIVSGEGKVYATPNIAKISVGITQSGALLATVQKDVNTKTQKLTAAIKNLGVEDKDIKTTSYYLYPQYDYTTGSGKITGYEVSTTYQITIRDIDKINDVISTATASGANAEGGITFDLNDETKKEKLQEARVQAISEAKEKAQGLASAAGLTLGKIINVSEDVPATTRLMNLPMAGGGTQDKTVTAPSIQTGQNEIDVTVSLSYEIR